MPTPEKLNQLGERIISEEQAPANADELLKIQLLRDDKIAKALENNSGATEVYRLQKLSDEELLAEVRSNVIPFKPRTETEEKTGENQEVA